MKLDDLNPWSEEEDRELIAAILSLVEAMRAVWVDPNFGDAYWTFDQSKTVVVTSLEGHYGAGRIRRGDAGVSVDVTSQTNKQSKKDARVWISHSLYSKDGVQLVGYGQEQRPSTEWNVLVEAREHFIRTIIRTSTLNLRLICSIGRRIDPVELILEHLAAGEIERYATMLRHDIAEVMSDAAASLGAHSGAELQSLAAEDFAGSIHSAFVRLAKQEYFEYEAIAFLNGPVLQDERIEFLRELISGPSEKYPIEVRSVHLSYTTDEHLSYGVVGTSYSGAKLPTGTENSNLSIVIALAIPVHADPHRYYDLYPIAEHVASVVLEALRLVRPEDIGISSIAIRSTNDYSPWAPSVEWVYSGARVAQWTPRRPTYATASEHPITAPELQAAIELAKKILEPPTVVGLPIAQRRFRDGYERYPADDPERLLEFTIALEAILLNDQDGTNELQFRTQLRAARFLETSFPERNEVMTSVRDLYFVRSKFAHGSTIDEAKTGEMKKLRRALENGPKILRQAIRKMLMSEGPDGLEGNALRDWWRQIELS